MKRIFAQTVLISALCLLPYASTAQEAEKASYGSLTYADINHKFGGSGWFSTLHLEHNSLRFETTSLVYARTIVGYNFNKWLQADVAYDLMRMPNSVTVHRAVLDITGTVKTGDFKLSLRERYLHDWKPSLGTQGNMVRSRFKFQYDIPNSRFSPSIAIEMFSWGLKWDKTRTFFTCLTKLNDHFYLDISYIWYINSNLPMKHDAGLGLVFFI